jgi:predicted HD superfamily hydrolase involved in NAD metabolism
MIKKVLEEADWLEHPKTVEIEQYLKEKLKPRRYAHVLSVRDTAVDLARRHAADPQKLNFAGLLHDCAKWMNPDELYKAAMHYGIQLDGIERANPSVLHARIGAELATDYFDISHPEILSAIRVHTTGNGAMTLINKILYVADFAEPKRTYKEAGLVLKLANQDLNRAVLEVSRYKIERLLAKGVSIHPNTIDAYNSTLRELRDTR